MYLGSCRIFSIHRSGSTVAVSVAVAVAAAAVAVAVLLTRQRERKRRACNTLHTHWAYLGVILGLSTRVVYKVPENVFNFCYLES